MPTTRSQTIAARCSENITIKKKGRKRQKSKGSDTPLQKNFNGKQEKPPKKQRRMQAPKAQKPKAGTRWENMNEGDFSQNRRASEDFHKRHDTLEKGHIYFFYRPKVAIEESHTINDVSKFYFLLMPRPDEENSSLEASAASAPAPRDTPKVWFRHIAIGKKRLPDTEAKHEGFWASVVNIGDDLEALETGLEEQVYQTKTRGARHLQPARLAGRGVYAIYSPTDETLPASKRNQTYLAYHLSHPAFLGEVQSELGIQLSSSFILQVKNPDAPTAPQVGLNPERRASYPSEGKREAFGEGVAARKFVPANPTTLLNYIGAELLLIGNKKNIGDVIGKGHAEEVERSASDDAHDLSIKEIMHELLLDVERFPPDALEGKWI